MWSWIRQAKRPFVTRQRARRSNCGYSHAVELLEDRYLLAVSLVKDLADAPDGSYVREFVELNGSVVFGAYDGHGQELWVSDGTSSGTMLVRETLTDHPFAPHDF